MNKKGVAALSARRMVVKKSTQGPTTCDGTVAQFGTGGLEGVEGDEKVEKHVKEKGRSSLALDGAGAGVFMCLRTSMLEQAG